MPGGIKKVEIPPEVRATGRPALAVVTTRTEVSFFLCQDEWLLKKYPRDCPLELRLGTWEIDDVLLVALLLRVARADETTFDCWVDAGNPNGLRIIQNLAAQNDVDLHLAADEVARSVRLPNTVRLDAMRFVEKVRVHSAWSTEDFARALARLNQLYPTPHGVWWACEEIERMWTPEDEK